MEQQQQQQPVGRRRTHLLDANEEAQVLELRALQLQLLILGRQALFHPPHSLRKNLLVIAHRGEQLRLRAACAAVVVATRSFALVPLAISGVIMAVD